MPQVLATRAGILAPGRKTKFCPQQKQPRHPTTPSRNSHTPGPRWPSLGTSQPSPINKSRTLIHRQPSILMFNPLDPLNWHQISFIIANFAHQHGSSSVGLGGPQHQNSGDSHVVIAFFLATPQASVQLLPWIFLIPRDAKIEEKFRRRPGDRWTILCHQGHKRVDVSKVDEPWWTNKGLIWIQV